ncbi:hypothetical protein [Paraburkholderia unamae]|uniref:Uncharacterized protein n=1 Tax=Paraburkholderia unamae TaxID=219649 RepID=A0ABX5KPM8_9BURK|nr:hypothetical protein [Paraburkholderia unamae]PVX84358.1 hypothetical protein C7402_105199 [Paraburkholderia unamae]
MTVTSDVQSVIYQTDGSSVDFPIPFYFLRESEITVDKIDSDGDLVELVLGTDFTVSGAGVQTGGTLTTTSTYAAGFDLHIYREVEATQESQYQQNDPFPSKTTEKALDKLTMLIQQVMQTLARALLFPKSDLNPKNTLPVARQRANKGLGFDSAGDVLMIDMTIGSVSVPFVRNVDMLRLVSRFAATEVMTAGYRAAGDGGGQSFYLDATDETSSDDGGSCIVAADGGRWKPVSISIDVLKFGADASGTQVSSAAFDAALALVTKIVTQQGSPYPAPTIEVPPGRYKLNKTLSLMPWHRFRSLGVVHFDFSALDVAADGIVMRNEQTAIAGGNAKWASIAPFLDGTAGAIYVEGPGKTVSTGWGIRMGNTTAASSDIRDTGGTNVIVTGWRGALRYDPINLYLITWSGCRFEQNMQENLYVTLGTVVDGVAQTAVVNSGEKMSFIDCTFAAAVNAVYHNCDGYTYEFDACSFDYHSVPFKVDALGRYSKFLLRGGHSEAFDALWFDATVSGTRVELIMHGHDILPTHYVDTTYIGSPRKLIEGNAANRLRLSAFGNSLRYVWRPYLPDTPVVGDNVLIQALEGTIQEGYYIPLARSRSMGRDYAFTVNAIGTSGDALTHWTRDAGIVDVDVREINTTTTLGQSLHLHGAAADSTIAFHTNESIPCRAGDNFCPGCDVFANGTTGDLNIRVFLRCYDYQGNQIGTDLGATYKMADAYADANVPNYALGRNRAMTIDHQIQTIPTGAATFKIYLTVNSFVGDVYIKNVRAVRA